MLKLLSALKNGRVLLGLVKRVYLSWLCMLLLKDTILNAFGTTDEAGILAATTSCPCPSSVRCEAPWFPISHRGAGRGRGTTGVRSSPLTGTHIIALRRGWMFLHAVISGISRSNRRGGLGIQMGPWQFPTFTAHDVFFQALDQNQVDVSREEHCSHLTTLSLCQPFDHFRSNRLAVSTNLLIATAHLPWPRRHLCE